MEPNSASHLRKTVLGRYRKQRDTFAYNTVFFPPAEPRAATFSGFSSKEGFWRSDGRLWGVPVDEIHAILTLEE